MLHSELLVPRMLINQENYVDIWTALLSFHIYLILMMKLTEAGNGFGEGNNMTYCRGETIAKGIFRIVVFLFTWLRILKYGSWKIPWMFECLNVWKEKLLSHMTGLLCAQLNLVDKNLCENCSYSTLKQFVHNSFGGMCFLEESYK